MKRPPGIVEARLRVLLSEGASTSAREALTALGLAGHHVEVCDPDPHCLARLSRFCRKWHRCPALGTDPRQYVAFLAETARARSIDLVLPVHEQGLALTAVPDLFGEVHLALPDHDTYLRGLDKARFSALLDELGIPQPATRFVDSAEALRSVGDLPVVVKAAIGTASRSVWIVHGRAALDTAAKVLEVTDGFEHPVLVQALVEGGIGHVQSVFRKGALLGIHGYRQLKAGAGGGEALKESHLPDAAREAVERIGEALAWHGGVSFDYITDARDGTLRFIDCNPRLVEPMSAWLAGLDLVDLLLAVSMGLKPEPRYPAPDGVRTRLGLQGLLGAALKRGTRRAVLGELLAMTFRRGDYRGSREELTPVRYDFRSVMPLTATALSLLMVPKAAESLVRKGWGRHLLTVSAVHEIERMAAEDGAFTPPEP